MNIIGRGRYATLVYPERRPVNPAQQTAFAFDQNTTPYSQVASAPAVTVASANITVAAGSRIKVEGRVAVVGSVAAGAALIFTPSVASAVAIQSFNTTQGTNNRTLNYLGVTDPQAGGLVTVELHLTVSGAGGAQVDGADVTLTLTEIPA